MISYKEAADEIDSLPWPDQVRFELSKNMMYLTISRSSLMTLNAIGLIQFEDCVHKAMIYLRAVNPAIQLAVT